MAALIPSSLVLTAAATILSKNVYKIWKPNTSDDQLRRLSRMLVPVISIVTLYFTFNGRGVDFYLVSYGIVASWHSCFQHYFSVLWKKTFILAHGSMEHLPA